MDSIYVYVVLPSAPPSFPTTCCSCCCSESDRRHTASVVVNLQPEMHVVAIPTEFNNTKQPTVHPRLNSNNNNNNVDERPFNART